ncbi:MAG: amino acid adenylation domain-containing protein [Microcystis aeruginosa G13-10]|nr:amino acid adenylation domain-containing protein [Microcystis aeruginosa G13-10]
MNSTNRQNVADIYPLSPMQQGMLFHSLYEPDADVYFVQFSCNLKGNVDTTIFEQAWQRLVEKYVVFRTAFIWEALSQPVQVVYRQVTVRVATYDWQHLTAQQQEQELAVFLESDQQKSLELSEAPLMRLNLIKLDKNTYQFVWSSHHLLLDGWSLSLVIKDFLKIYQEISQNQISTDQPVVSYRQYIAWLQQQEQKPAEEFWQQKLQGFTAPTPLVIERSSNSKNSNVYKKQQIQFPASTTAACQSFVRKNRLTLNNLVQATWGLLLSRYSQETDIVFGATVSGRETSIAGIEAMVGLFINTLPMRIQVKPDTSALTLLKDLQAQLVESNQYSYSSLAEIQTWSEIPRSASLFDSIVVFENYPVDATAVLGNDSFYLENIQVSQQTNYPLTLIALPGEQLQVRISYDTNRFDDGTITRLLGHFQTLLEGIVANPEARVSQLPLLTEFEKNQLLIDGHNPQVDYPVTKCLHQLFEEQVKRTPEAVAVVYSDQQLTYNELNNRANHLAHYLQSLGVKPDQLVGICLERSLEMIVGLLGILKAGGAYVPLDPEYPIERLSFMLEDAQLSVLLTQQKLGETLPQHQAQIIYLDTDWEKIAENSHSNLENTVTPDNLAYVIYTSGSTGKPKGVLVNHSNVVRLFAATDAWYNFNSQDVWSLFHSYAFDFSVWEMWGALLYGGCLVVVPYLVTRSPEAFYQLLCQEKVTILNQTPTAFRQLIQVEESLKGSFPPLSRGVRGDRSSTTDNDLSLRLVIFGGEALEIHSLQPWFNRHGDQCPQLVNMYGITETTVHVTYRPLSMTDLDSTASVIGCPIPDLQVYLLDQYLQLVPVGVPGEMYVGGAGVTKGYLNRPELTTERFIPSPFDPPLPPLNKGGTQGGAKLYKTGDLARYLPKGELEYLGRIDNQVKIRGFRIELGEIEALLASHPQIWETVVIVRDDTTGDKRLVAYIVPQSEKTITINEIRQFLKAKLPSYMIPNAFVILDALPLTANGKIDRRALPPSESSSEPSEKYVAPRNPIEDILVNVWSEILKVEKVGINDNFFELGGHSLLATKLVAQIRDRLKVELPLRQLFNTATLAELAQGIEQLKQEKSDTIVPTILPRKRPLSYAQQRLWFLDQLEPNSSFYNVPLALHLAGDLQADILEKSLQKIIQRHESLRTNFATVEGNPVQVIKPESNWQLTLVNGKDSPKYREDQEIKKWLEIHSHQPFDLANDSLIRATLLKLSDTEHFLLICLHHIVSDGWSMGVFIQELTTLYNAYTKGLEPLLPELPIQYADFAIWQREYLQGEIRQNQLNYWQKQLAAAPALLHLPTDRPRPPEQRFEGDQINGILSPELSQDLNKLSREKGVTLFMTLLTAFKVLLYRYTGQEDILVGTPIANRTRSELAGLIGFFVNTLVLRTDLAGNPSFSEALKQVRKTATDAYDHQDLPFEMLVEALQPERNMSYTPLFQVMFGLDNEVLNEMDLEGIKATPQPLEFKKAKFDISLFIQVKEAGLTAHWEYNTDLFNSETIERMNGHFLALLEGIIANPSERISQLPLLTKSEQQQLLIDWNNTEVDYPVDKCIHQLFEEQVERTPDTVAVIFEEQELTYNELNCRANQLAHYLQSLGVKPDELVGICVERSLEMIVGLLGILKAGGAYVPLDPDYPLERISLMLEDAGLKVLLTQQKLIDKLSESQANINIVCVDADLPVISKEEQKNLITTIKYSNLAYVIYTSGSTGIPKGVLVTHQGLLNLVFWHQNTFEITNLDKATQLAGTGFDAAVWELWPYLTAGASIYLVKPEILISLVELQKWLAAKKITISFLPTPIAEQLLSLEWTEINVSLRTILTGGDKLNQYPSNFIPFQVVNNYGPTENTVVTTSGVVISGEKNNSLSPAIGRPIFNTQIYILDSNLQPVPVGIPGEIHISGAGLARGYLNRPELTQEKFIPNPFSNSPDSRLYKTGDLARYLPDGNLEYLGRIDNQVKIRGFRIELGEIETILSQHSAVKTAIVIAREDETEQKRLVAYIVPQAEGISAQQEQNFIAVTELRQFLKAKLPEYMIPSAFVILESLPLTPNGKIDRRALPAPEFQSEEQYVAPRNPIEEILSSIWVKVLKVAQVGIHDNFFELGGHSLLATQLISRIREAFQVEMPLRELFVAPTIAELAQEIKRISEREQLTELPILPRDKTAELPLSFAQTRLWFLAEFESNSSFYNIPLALSLEGTLNSQILIQSLEEICARHEALRTNFITVDGIPTQIIQTRTWTVTVVDLQHLSSSEKVIASQELTQNQAIQPFDLASEPLIRTTLVVLSETEHILLVCMHHIVSDGWSMGVFLQELTDLYNAYIQNQPSSLSPLPIQYGDYTLWQKQWLQGDILQRQLDYWQKQLADAPALLSLPTDRPRPAVQSFAGAHLPFSLSWELTEKLTQLTQEQGVTLFMTLLTAFAVLLYRYTEQEDILIGTPIANRNRREIEGLIGFFVNTLVLRIDLSGKPNFNQLLGRVREMAMDAYAHQDLPFEMLVEVLQQNSPPSPLELTGLTATPLTTENDTAKFDLTLAMENTGAGLQGVWEYNTDLFDRSTIERLTGNFITLLEALVVNPQQPIFQLPLLTEVQSQALLEDWNATEKEYPFHHCIHHLFEEQAARTPAAVAVVFEGQELTYQELNIQANQLAHYLKSLEVNSEVLVGIYLERSLLVIVGLLAVLKAGGAYLPLDPDYPQQRLTYMAEDAQISLLLTQESLLDSLPVEDVGVIVLDKLAEILTVQSPENPFSEVVSENLLCLLYTSGSTGKPKGVMLTHAALVNHSWGISEVFGLTESDRVLQFASFGFDVAAEEIFPTWLKGGTVVLRPGQMFATLTDFANFIEQERLTVLNITPAYWHEWALAVSQSLATVPSSLRVVAVGGDAVLPETVNIWRQMVGKRVQCINVYGPTEASVTAIVHDLLDYQSEKINSVLIGRPIANTKAYVLDQNLQPVPIGVKGELHLCGVRLARGYLNRPELTAEKFINNPFANAAFNRLYKTGDLARYLPDGNIECFGRIDNQVKIRGFRIELGEIEAVLNQNIDVQTSCVIIREDTPGDKYLVAYIVAHYERIPMISELRQFLSSKLPLYMVPQAFVFLESLPLTTNRKVDRRALPAPDKIGSSQLN